MSKVSTQFKKGHTSPGPGRPRLPENTLKHKANNILKAAKVEPISYEDALELQNLIVSLAKEGNETALKIAFDRIDNPSYVTIDDLPVVGDLSDTKAYRKRIMESVSAREMPIAQADALVKLVKQSNEADLSESAKKIKALLGIPDKQE